MCPKCGYHVRIGSWEYFNILFDNCEYEPLFTSLSSKDFLGFVDLKKYDQRLAEAKEKTGLPEAVSVAIGEVEGYPLIIACMDFRFIGGSMGSVVGEKISNSVDYAIENKVPFLMISKSGGAE